MEGYKNLASYILATVVHDLTVLFVKRWVNPYSRTTDQMEQAARSGKQNIAEGYTVQSLESYIKLCGVAEGSIKELAIDFEDFLRNKFIAEGGFRENLFKERLIEKKKQFNYSFPKTNWRLL